MLPVLVVVIVTSSEAPHERVEQGRLITADTR
jgi:hypothetical protein